MKSGNIAIMAAEEIKAAKAINIAKNVKILAAALAHQKSAVKRSALRWRNAAIAQQWRQSAGSGGIVAIVLAGKYAAGNGVGNETNALAAKAAAWRK